MSAGARQEGTLRRVDRWAGTDGEYDRWAGTDHEYDRWAEPDGQYDRHDRLTRSAGNPKAKWIGLLLAWVVVAGVLLVVVHLTIAIWVVMAALIGYVIYRIVRETPREHAQRPRRQPPAPAAAAPAAEIMDNGRERFNAPPGWPEPPPGWTPPPGWQPNPAWPPAPRGWQFWLPPARRDYGDHNLRARHHRRDPDDDRFTDGWR